MDLATARKSYYEVNHFPDDGGASLPYVPLKLGPLTLKVPNTAGRKVALAYHDLHHVVTGYQTTFRGESEIAAWELASGCEHYPAAVMYNLAGLAFGAIVWPRATARAWALGRRTKNFYGRALPDLLPREVTDAREELGLGKARVPVRAGDVASMIGYILTGPIRLAASAVKGRSRNR
ncbi:MAG: hypothetical protein QM831_13395 [Kofleriaceae bacterium]